jgi:hypothetical protein
VANARASALASGVVLTVGERIPPATVWRAPREPVSLPELAAERPLLLLFYLFDWSST